MPEPLYTIESVRFKQQDATWSECSVSLVQDAVCMLGAKDVDLTEDEHDQVVGGTVLNLTHITFDEVGIGVGVFLRIADRCRRKVDAGAGVPQGCQAIAVEAWSTAQI